MSGLVAGKIGIFCVLIYDKKDSRVSWKAVAVVAWIAEWMETPGITELLRRERDAEVEAEVE